MMHLQLCSPQTISELKQNIGDLALNFGREKLIKIVKLILKIATTCIHAIRGLIEHILHKMSL